MKSITKFITEAAEKPNKKQLLTIIAGKISEYLLGLECEVPGYAVGEDDEDSVSVSWDEAIDFGHYNSLTELLDAYDYFNELADETKDTLHMSADQLSRFIDTNENEILKLI